MNINFNWDPEMTCGFLIYLVFCSICLRHLSVTPFLEGAPPPRKNPASAPGVISLFYFFLCFIISDFSFIVKTIWTGESQSSVLPGTAKLSLGQGNC